MNTFRNTNFKISQIEVILHIIFWSFIFILYYLTFMRVYPVNLTLLRSFGNILPLAGLFYLNLYLVNKYLETQKYVEYFVVILIIFVALVYIRAQINWRFPEIDLEKLLRNQLQNWALGAMMSNVAIISLSAFISLLHYRYRNEKRHLTLIQERQEAQLQFLRAQINPHFLFNTLNNIYYLAYMKSDKTADMVLRLSNLLRYVIYEGKESTVSLKKEVSYLQLFIELYQMRNEEPLDISFEVQDDIPANLFVEPMILIPIVENCFKHCNFETSNAAYIHLNLKLSEGSLYFHAVNTKDESDLQKDKIGGVGLINIKKRLELKYPNEYKLVINNTAALFDLQLQLKIIET